MKYAPVAGLDKPVSRLVLGSMAFDPTRSAHWFALLDRYSDDGGNCVDTAAIYGDGAAERTVGAWTAERGNRDDLVLIGKGACTTGCTPDLVTTELRESLRRLGTDRVDFRKWWSGHQVHERTHGIKRMTHPAVGPITLRYEALSLPGDEDQTLFLYHTDPGSSSHDNLRLLSLLSEDRTRRPTGAAVHRRGERDVRMPPASGSAGPQS